MTAIAPPDRRWVFGPIPDLLFGCGLGYAALITIIAFLPFELQTLALAGTVGSLVIGAPHYGATLMRVYRRAEDRRKYRLFTVYLSLFVWLWFGAGLYHVALGSALITLYFTWSPYHYTGQNYGLAVMFLRRRGIAFDDATKKWLYASFMLSFALSFVSLHRHMGGVSTGGDFSGTPYYFIHLGIPLGVQTTVFAGLLGLYGIATVVAFGKLLSVARPIDLLPVAALVLAQALWFSVPETWLWLTGTALSSQGVGWLFIWAILGHSVQYLWITSYYAVGREGGRKRWAYLFSTLGAGSAIWTLPALVFSPQLFGTHPYSLGLFLMITAGVNVHHFILDGAIWKLRDTGVGAVLLAEAAPESKPGHRAQEPNWLGPLGWALAGAFTLLSLFGAAEDIRWEQAFYGAKIDQARSSAARLTLIGRADPRFALTDARAAAAAGDVEGAEKAYQRSLELYPTAEAYFGVAALREQEGDRAASREALQRSLSINDQHAGAHRMLGRSFIREGDFDQGIVHLTRAAQLVPDPRPIQKEIVAARARKKRAAR